MMRLDFLPNSSLVTINLLRFSLVLTVFYIGNYLGHELLTVEQKIYKLNVTQKSGEEFSVSKNSETSCSGRPV